MADRDWHEALYILSSDLVKHMDYSFLVVLHHQALETIAWP